VPAHTPPIKARSREAALIVDRQGPQGSDDFGARPRRQLAVSTGGEGKVSGHPAVGHRSLASHQIVSANAERTLAGRSSLTKIARALPIAG